MSKPTEQSKDKVHLFNKFMIELELKPFTEAESARMLRRLSHSTEEVIYFSLIITWTRQYFDKFTSFFGDGG